MDILTAQWLTVVGFFAAMILSCLCPVWFIRQREAVFQGRRYTFALGLANCFSAGVFLATFFVGLLPEVRRQFQGVMRAHSIVTSFPITEFVVFLGFSLALFIEQLLVKCKKKSDCDSSRPASTKEDSGQDECESLPRMYGEAPGVTKADSSSSRASKDMQWKYEKLTNQHTHDSSKRTDSDCSNQTNHSVHYPNQDNHFHCHHHLSVNSHHGHSHDITAAVDQDSGVRFGILLMSLGVHSAFEGMTLGLQTRIPELINLFIGVLIHECLVAFAIGISIAKMKLRPWTTLQLVLLFSATIPAGQVFGLLLENHQSPANDAVSAVLQAVAAGTFIHITFLEVIPEGLEGDTSLLKLFFLFLGFLIIAIIPLVADIHDHRNHANQNEFKSFQQLRTILPFNNA